MENAGIREDKQQELESALTNIKSIFAELKEMPFDEKQKLDIAKEQIGGALLMLISKSMGVAGVGMDQAKPVMRKALTAMQQASSIDGVQQSIVDAVNDFGEMGFNDFGDLK